MQGDTFSFGSESQACKFRCSVKTYIVLAIFNCKWYYTKDQRKVKFVYVEIKYQLDATDDIYCRFYCMLNMFRAILYTIIFLQQLENLHMKPLLDSKCIMFYSRYVDDAIIIYDVTRTNPETII